MGPLPRGTPAPTPWDPYPVGARLRVRRTRAGLGRTVRSAHRGTVASQVLMKVVKAYYLITTYLQVLMQLLLRGQRLGPLEGARGLL